MGGGLMQLVAYGAQDVYLTGNPQITFFKVVYRRHTNFSMESIENVLNGTNDFGGRVCCTVSRNGDLINRIYIEHDATFTREAAADFKDVQLVEHYGHSLIKECKLEIGGQEIDKHTSLWNRVYSDLTEFNPTGYFGGSKWTSPVALPMQNTGTLYQLMSGNGHGLSSGTVTAEDEIGAGGATVNGFIYTAGATYVEEVSAAVIGKIEVPKIFIPLNFWFCRNPGSSLPLIALQYHEVKLYITYENISNLCRSADKPHTEVKYALYNSSDISHTMNTSIWVDYIYLDTDERRRFAQVSHEYLIEQLQINEFTINNTSHTCKLHFNHPVKELIWTTLNIGSRGRGQSPITEMTHGPVSVDNMDGNWKLNLNGHDRFAMRDSKYFTRTQIWQHHTGFGAQKVLAPKRGELLAERTTKQCSDGIAVYSFALKPEEIQPTGTCNFSRIDKSELIGDNLKIRRGSDSGGAGGSLEIKDVDDSNYIMKLTVFAVNYNVLRIMSGMGGLAYSN